MKNYMALCAVALPLMAFGQHKHVHGEAELTIALENQSVVIEFVSPSANLLGFESAPKNQEEVQAVKAVNAQLASFTNLIALNGGDCQQVDVELVAGVADSMESHDDHHHDHHHEHDDHHNDHNDHNDHDDHADHDEENHSDYKVTYELSCSDVSSINKLTVTGFNSFAGLETVDVDWVTANHQGSSELSPIKSLVEIKH